MRKTDLLLKLLVLFVLSFLVIAKEAIAFLHPEPFHSYKRTLRRNPFSPGKITGLYVQSGSLAYAKDFLSKYGDQWHFVWDSVTLTPLEVSGIGINMISDSMSIPEVETITRMFVDENSKLLRVSSGDLVLDTNASKRAGFYNEMYFIHFTQIYKGIEVLNSNIFFRYKFGRLIQFGSESFPDINLDTTPNVSSDESIRIAGDAVGYDQSHDRIESSGVLYVYPVLKDGIFEYKLVYKSVFFKSSPYGLWVVYVDANSGEVIESYSNVYYFQGRLLGLIHPRLSTDQYMQVPLENVEVDIGGTTKALTDERGVFGARVSRVGSVSLGLKGPLAMARECGTFVEVGENQAFCDATETKVVFTEDSSWQGADNVFFNLDDSNTSSAQRDSFFYVNRAVKWASGFLDLPWLKSPLVVNVDIARMVVPGMWGGFQESEVACNAFWDGRSVNFFTQGRIEGSEFECNNTANIADVVIHEWGHGLDENSGGIDDVAFSEGIADFIAALMTNDPHIGLSFYKDPDPLTGSTYLREISTDKVYPRDRNQDPHKEGLIISGAWWDLKSYLVQKYGQEKGTYLVSFLFLNHLLTAKKYTDSYSATLAVDDDNGNLADLTPNYTEIRKAFAAHGLVND